MTAPTAEEPDARERRDGKTNAQQDEELRAEGHKAACAEIAAHFQKLFDADFDVLVEMRNSGERSRDFDTYQQIDRRSDGWALAVGEMEHYNLHGRWPDSREGGEEKG